MNIVFSLHAQLRMKERNISADEVILALQFPEKSGTKDEKNFVMRRRNNGHLLITYYTDKSGMIKIITVITTSKISKYLGS